MSILTLIFKDEESCKMSARDTCALKLGGGGLINSPVLDNLHSLDIGAEYVFFFKYNYYFECHPVDSYFCVYFSWIKHPIF